MSLDSRIIPGGLVNGDHTITLSAEDIPLITVPGKDMWYEEMCRNKPGFSDWWLRDTRTIRDMLNARVLVAIDPARVRPTVTEHGQVVARCMDPDQADETWELVKGKYRTRRIAPLSATVGGPRMYPGSRFNRNADISPAWFADTQTIVDGKDIEDILLMCHVPCLGAWHADGVPCQFLFAELKLAKRQMKGELPGSTAIRGLADHAIDLAVQIDMRDTRERGLYLINESVMREYLLDFAHRDVLLPDHFRDLVSF